MEPIDLIANPSVRPPPPEPLSPATEPSGCGPPVDPPVRGDSSVVAMTHTEPTTIDLPAETVLTVSGSGDTDSPAFGVAVGALFAVRGALGGADVPLEGTYRQAGDGPFDLASPDGWLWALSVPMPPGATPAAVVAAASEVAPMVELADRPGGRAVALIHHGPYADEGPSLAALRAFAADQGLTITGPHTETYLTDPNRTPPADLRTRLRYPVR